ncbi:GDP-Man:Man(3)GlcNAc(2)-PP-Dol alpha-1,2-mannosyltransferase-like isoform X1 [Stegodyphus dumicola]|uniref:GDP-Man:Man(3)GlcNAc(2)-PP-Dol alpha-1,2-mannosyltransferase-like isoform X1 n=1 Tax=Stegodyphus dumicola TaxID=202533 RepID=UPI0015B21A4A|nr:GDP-Man:Man(3)GlcNAc(2)-PP-Dol alpha-1,2-mannosyltransferase-like isoform X1 [Stegodyphus dumicola]
MMSVCFMFGVYVLIFFIILLLIYFRTKKHLHFKKLTWQKKHSCVKSVGFFHPYCNAGGGGERVLWTAVHAVQKKYKDVHCLIYTGDVATSDEILKNVELHFNIKLSRPVEFMFLKKRYFVEARYYPYFTLLMQSLGSVILSLEAIFKHVPDIYIDTMGYAWTLPVFKYLGDCRIAAYVHYPTISTDMLHAVSARKVTVNNRIFISKSTFFSYLKLLYYTVFAYLYGLMGRHAEIIMVNSSWTRGHILELWKKPACTFIVYPPCDVTEFEVIPLKKHIDKNSLRIISIAQFRPEKNHKLQLNAFHKFLQNVGIGDNSVTLVLIGSCRDEEDHQRVQDLKDTCKTLGISENVEFKINLTFQEIIHEMRMASLSLHTMWNEHFGIGVVECMSAGLIMIAHNSGGPKLDIVINFNSKKTGFLANDVDSYADTLETIWRADPETLYEIRKTARESTSRFSVLNFEKSFLDAVSSLFT